MPLSCLRGLWKGGESHVYRDAHHGTASRTGHASSAACCTARGPASRLVRRVCVVAFLVPYFGVSKSAKAIRFTPRVRIEDELPAVRSAACRGGGARLLTLLLSPLFDFAAAAAKRRCVQHWSRPRAWLRSLGAPAHSLTKGKT
jgi:hypothetical protein